MPRGRHSMLRLGSVDHDASAATLTLTVAETGHGGGP